jgi:hypothetical protein
MPTIVDPRNGVPKVKKLEGSLSHRTPYQLATERAEVMKLMRLGWGKSRIAQKLERSYTTIESDWNWCLSQLANEMKATREQLTSVIQAQYEQVKVEAWEAFERSKQPLEREVIEDTEGDTGQGKRVTKRTTEGRTGNNDYLKTTLSVLQAERELLGIDAPKRVDMRQQLVVQWDDMAGEVEQATGSVEDDLRHFLGDNAVQTISSETQTVEQVEPSSDTSADESIWD